MVSKLAKPQCRLVGMAIEQYPDNSSQITNTWETLGKMVAANPRRRRIVDNITNGLFPEALRNCTWPFVICSMEIFKHKPIYLDHQATTPVDERVLAAMVPFFTEYFGNPASNHFYGWTAAAAIDRVRAQVAEAIGAKPEEIIFTSGATEANNLAIKGVAEASLQRGRHIITVKTEHSAVLAPCGYLEKLGFSVTYLPVDDRGLIAIADLAAAMRPDTILVSVMAANNEIGVIQPLAEIGQICQQHQVPFHTDGVQAIGYVPMNVDDCGVDLLSLTAHKLYGPKGIGALYVRSGQALAAQQLGGGKEKRAGTLATMLIVGLGEAIELGMAMLVEESLRLQTLRDSLWQQLQKIPDVQLNGDLQQRLPHNLNVNFAGVQTSGLLRELQPLVALSSGSACANGQPSHVLAALGRSKAEANLRFGLGRGNTQVEIDRVAEATIKAIRLLRG
jgi:cysteine desulfurase